MKSKKIGFAMCGSFCTFDEVIDELEKLSTYDVEITPIMSEISQTEDTRFGTAKEFKRRVEEICGKHIISSINEAEPVGPKALFDVMVIAPCTGNTLAKIANGITDSSVTMSAKAHLRNERPLVIAISTNDALSGGAKNIGELLTRKNIYFVPFGQDDPYKKPRSCIADFTKIVSAIEEAENGRQIQPLLCPNKVDYTQ
jgi:dipicolinate synthase subunit B